MGGELQQVKNTAMDRFIVAKNRGYTGSLREFQQELKASGTLVMKERKRPPQKRKPRELERHISYVVERANDS